MCQIKVRKSQKQIISSIKIDIWGANLVLCSALKFGRHPGGSYGGQGVYRSMWELRVGSGPR